MQLMPDWSAAYKPPKFEEIFGIPFRGQGFYCTRTDTILVLPRDSTGWESTRIDYHYPYSCHVYNCQFGQTVFAHITHIPVRQVSR